MEWCIICSSCCFVYSHVSFPYTSFKIWTTHGVYRCFLTFLKAHIWIVNAEKPSHSRKKNKIHWICAYTIYSFFWLRFLFFACFSRERTRLLRHYCCWLSGRGKEDIMYWIVLLVFVNVVFFAQALKLFFICTGWAGLLSIYVGIKYIFSVKQSQKTSKNEGSGVAVWYCNIVGAEWSMQNSETAKKHTIFTCTSRLAKYHVAKLTVIGMPKEAYAPPLSVYYWYCC